MHFAIGRLFYEENHELFLVPVKSSLYRKICNIDSLFGGLTVLRGCGSPVVKVSDHGRYVMSSSPVPLKTHRVGQRCTLNLSRTETSSRWCGMLVRRGGATQVSSTSLDDGSK
ncbi:uncharacterized protein TNCV_1011501 [Trichonephila clavipes]|uniref:Uncharacterized protein n=1 Tax=Trichonephila clavipes TaxID=2585209 RepID=A0A8X6VWZ0_TRICX|nr:uncharacterized protein TNCV_1011501 [Trichonephila clavipes]